MQGPITVDELERAKRGIAKREQEMVFPAEIKALKEGKSMSHQSYLIYFNPFIDKDNLIRVGGRLKHAEINASIKHPILLPQRSKFTELIIEYEHSSAMHAGINATLAAVRRKYWPIKARDTERYYETV